MKPIQFDVAMLQLSDEKPDVFDHSQFIPSPPLGIVGGVDGGSELAQQFPKTVDVNDVIEVLCPNCGECVIEVLCPDCGEWVEDFDGFRVLIHEACGYCSHPDSLVNEDGTCTCEVCGQTFEPEGF